MGTNHLYEKRDYETLCRIYIVTNVLLNNCKQNYITALMTRATDDSAIIIEVVFL